MAQAISIADKPESRNTVQEVIQKGLRSSVRRGATQVLSYLLDQGAEISTITAGAIMNTEELVKPSREVLEILIARGWDINSWGPNCNDWPLLWFVTSYPGLVEWCLTHRASVDLPGDIPPVLEIAAGSGSVATFELLQARGAPLGRLTLHRAVKQAFINAPSDDSIRDALFEQRMDMVKHLVDIVGLDVNAVEPWPGKWCSTPLCYAAFRNYRKDAKELIWFLLDRGADPNRTGPLDGDIILPSALESAQSCRNTRFLEAVREWPALQRNNTTT
ncbi:hypothetical protein DPV78_004209 [Talaromyces pinophilus]|nr:hypothetical protein DPV78_004209 [Talaromyces pinophilus]